MFDIRHQKQKVSELKARIAAEREAMQSQLQVLVPQVRRAAVVGSLAWSARKALPLLQPLAIGLASRGVGKTTLGTFARVAGLAAAAFGVWQRLRPKN